MLKRRQFLQVSAAAALGALYPISLLGQGRPRNPLRIPDLLDGERLDGIWQYALEAGQGRSLFLPGLETATLGFNGNYLGPTLRLRKDEEVRIGVHNRLDETITVHWHGLHLPAIADGGPHQEITADGRWDARFRVNQNASTCWYHSHQIHKTGEQVYRGLAGMILLEDEQSRALELPDEYGVDDIPLIIQDRRFYSDGSLRYIENQRDIMMGHHGDTMLVNGTFDPVFVPVTRRVRFRVLNASNARNYRIAFSDRRQFHQLACDGGFLAEPLAVSDVTLAAGERCEIVADFGDGAPVDLVSLPLPDNSPLRSRGMMGGMMGAIANQGFHLLAIEPQSQLTATPELPPVLASVPDPASFAVDRVRRFELDMRMGMMGGGRGRRGGMGGDRFSINGRSMDMGIINERVPLDSTEIWEIHNNSPMMHPFHIHHGQFRILDRNGRAPGPHERAFKDTVIVAGGETVRVVMRFENYADPVTPYMYHCHILEHEDNGMMGQFVVE